MRELRGKANQNRKSINLSQMLSINPTLLTDKKDQRNKIDEINEINQINQMDQKNQTNETHETDEINEINQINQIDQTNQTDETYVILMFTVVPLFHPMVEAKELNSLKASPLTSNPV